MGLLPSFFFQKTCPESKIGFYHFPGRRWGTGRKDEKKEIMNGMGRVQRGNEFALCWSLSRNSHFYLYLIGNKHI